MLKCKPREEAETAMGIMSRYFDLKGTKEEFQIVSAISLTKMRGHIFIESFSIGEVKKAVSTFLSINQEYIKVIPIQEVQSILSPDPQNDISLKEN
jgi:hypothetical protein